MDPDLPGLTADELHTQFRITIQTAEANGFKAFAVFLNDNIFKEEVGYWQQTNMSVHQVRDVLTTLLHSLPSE